MRGEAYINGNPIWEHVVSSGTLKSEDLIRNFCHEIRRLCVRTPDIVWEAEAWVGGFESWKDFNELGSVLTDRTAYDEDGPEIVSRLQDQLQHMAPDGWRFGTEEGDGASFGWWREEDEE